MAKVAKKFGRPRKYKDPLIGRRFGFSVRQIEFFNSIENPSDWIRKLIDKEIKKIEKMEKKNED